MAKESTHRADELKALGWSNEDVARYAELWDYRQRWGAINLEREDRLFLRKAEATLPKIINTKVTPKKLLQDKSYYRWLSFYLNAMNEAELTFNFKNGERGAWPIILEEELRALDYYQPVLGLPDTLKAKGFYPIREELVKSTSDFQNTFLNEFEFDFQAPLDALNAKEPTKWRYVRDENNQTDRSYPVLSSDSIDVFRKRVREKIVYPFKDLLPSLAESQKPEIPDDWRRTSP